MKTRGLAKERIIVALDVATEEEALDLVSELGEHVGMFKVGLELLTSVGIELVDNITAGGAKVFLDGKFNDIPATVAGASRAATRRGVNMFTVHTMGGLEMMRAAAEAAREEASALAVERPLILGVTVLTSVDQSTMNRQLRIPGDVDAQVAHLATLALEAGLDGVIASPLEIDSIVTHVPGRMVIVTPGIRPDWAAADDQKRIMTPAQAVLKGASYLVIGRPITRPPRSVGAPADAATLIAKEISTALARKGVYSGDRSS